MTLSGLFGFPLVCGIILINVADYIDVTHKGGIEHLALQEKFIEGFKKYMENRL